MTASVNSREALCKQPLPKWAMLGSKSKVVKMIMWRILSNRMNWWQEPMQKNKQIKSISSENGDVYPSASYHYSGFIIGPHMWPDIMPAVSFLLDHRQQPHTGTKAGWNESFSRLFAHKFLRSVSEPPRWDNKVKTHVTVKKKRALATLVEMDPASLSKPIYKNWRSKVNKTLPYCSLKTDVSDFYLFIFSLLPVWNKASVKR